jgi:hypothetical protein
MEKIDNILFEESLVYTLKFESKYHLVTSKITNIIEESYKGICRNDYPDINIWNIIDYFKIKTFTDFSDLNDTNNHILNNEQNWIILFNILDKNEILDTEIKNFYKENFWNILEDLEINDQLKSKFFDIFVNLYTHKGSELIEKSLNQYFKEENIINSNIFDLDTLENKKYKELLIKISRNYISTDYFLNTLCENQKQNYIEFCNKYSKYKDNLELFTERAKYRGL